MILASQIIVTCAILQASYPHGQSGRANTPEQHPVLWATVEGAGHRMPRYKYGEQIGELNELHHRTLLIIGYAEASKSAFLNTSVHADALLALSEDDRRALFWFTENKAPDGTANVIIVRTRINQNK